MGAPIQVCEACGTIVPAVDDLLSWVAARDEQIEAQRETIDNLNAELNSKLATIKRLKVAQHRQLLNDPHYEDAMDVLRHWRDICHPAARELGGKRLEAVEARLTGGYTVAELKRACDGYALKPYIGNRGRVHEGPKDTWAADAELIFRDAKHVDSGLAIAARADQLRTLGHPGGRKVASAPQEGLSELGAAALRLAARGGLVFPIQARSKAPATRNGFLDAKTNAEDIRRAWTQHPDFNVGLRTGAESGIVVLDVDDDKGGLESLRGLERKHGPLPMTTSAVTPSGGTHFWFQHPGVELRNTTGFPGLGLDFRGDGGYVLVPPSIGPNGNHYQWDERAAPVPLPEWLKDALLGYQSKQDAVLSDSTDWAQHIADGSNAGQRHDRMVRYVGHLIGRYGMDAREAFATARVANLNVRPPLGDKEIADIVRWTIGKEHR